MEYRTCLFFAVATLCLIQQSPVCEANWFQDLMSRFRGNGNNQAKDAHAAVYGNEENNDPQPFSPNQSSRPNQKHKGSWTHELIAAAAGFEAMRTYERHQAKQKGQPPNHSIVKGILAGLTAAAVDRLIETKGLDWIDSVRAKQGAQRTAEDMVNQAERGQDNNGNRQGGFNGRDSSQVGRGRTSDNQGNRGRDNNQPPAGGETYNYQAATSGDEY